MSDGYDPDFVERNGAWLLSVFGLMSACTSAVLMYFLKSRCTRITCCGMECVRDVVDLNTVPHSAFSLTRSPFSRFFKTSKETPPVVNSDSV